MGAILSWVETGKIAIPEIQRPFVWNSPKVRDLIDSLYQGYPIGYLITWQSDQVKLRDGSTSTAKQILIDGQQRVTALAAALAGQPIVNKDYKQVQIRIAFNPLAERFETYTPVMRNDPSWIPDVSVLMEPAAGFTVLEAFMVANPDADRAHVMQSLTKLIEIKNKQVGIIDLESTLDIETVTEIFIRINSKGVVLNTADFAMSKIASYGEYGSQLRKFIDYFCHLAVAPHFYETIKKNDPDFAKTDYFKHISWLKDDSSDLYDPDYRDLIRVVGLKEFGRGRIDAVVSYLSGRDFETKTFDEALALESYQRLERGLYDVTRKHDFTQFTMIIASAGFIDSSMLTSQNALNFAYALYLKLREDKSVSFGEIQRVVRRWFVMSMLTGRHSGSFEAQFEQDMRRVRELGAANYLKSIEDSELSDGFWETGLPSAMVTSSSLSPYFKAFLAAQVKSSAKGFLSRHITVQNMLDGAGDIHHIFPKDYLDKNGIKDRSEKNQIANYVLTETGINIAVGSKAPAEYMGHISEQAATKALKIGEIDDIADVRASLQQNAIPESIFTVRADDYQAFLIERRILMAQLIREYYVAL